MKFVVNILKAAASALTCGLLYTITWLIFVYTALFLQILLAVKFPNADPIDLLASAIVVLIAIAGALSLFIERRRRMRAA